MRGQCAHDCHFPRARVCVAAATVLHRVVQQLRDVVTMESELRMCRTAAEVLKGVIAAEEAKLANAWARVMARRGGQEPTIAMRHIRHVSEGSVRVFRRLITALEKYWVTLLYRADP